MYKVICEKYDDFLDGQDSVSVILKISPRRVHTYVRSLFLYIEFLLQNCTPPFLGKSHIQEGKEWLTLLMSVSTDTSSC